MEIERLLRDYQMALLNAEQADSHEDRAIYSGLAKYYGGRLTERRRSLGVKEDGWLGDDRGKRPSKCK